MAVEWDPAKNAANVAKHGIRFEFAAIAFGQRVIQWRDARADYGEKRWRGLAEIDGRVYFIAWTMRGPDTYRLISARRANERATKKFRQQTQAPEA